MSYKKLRKKNQWNLKKQLKWDFFPKGIEIIQKKQIEFLEWKNSLSEMVQLEKNKGKRVKKKVKKRVKKKSERGDITMNTAEMHRTIRQY